MSSSFFYIYLFLASLFYFVAYHILSLVFANLIFYSIFAELYALKSKS